MESAIGFLGAFYLWLKAAHVIFVIFWISGLFMLPRFYVYHQPTQPGSPEDLMWIERERRLRKIIISPAMILVWIFGLMLVFDQGLWTAGWFQAKFVTALLLTAFHGWAVGYGKKLAAGYRPRSDRALRMMNEIPGVATAVIVILVVVRPF